MALKAILYTGVVFLFLIGHTLPVQAQTAVEVEPDQVKLVNEDGVLYLTTEIQQSAKIPSSTPSSLIQTVFVDNPNITLFTIQPPEGFAENIGDILNSLLQLIMVLSVLLVFISLIWGFFGGITSNGDRSKTERARNRIMSSIVGIIIVASAYAITTLVVRFLGYNSLSDTLTGIKPLDYHEQTLLELNQASSSAYNTPKTTPYTP